MKTSLTILFSIFLVFIFSCKKDNDEPASLNQECSDEFTNNNITELPGLGGMYTSQFRYSSNCKDDKSEFIDTINITSLFGTPYEDDPENQSMSHEIILNNDQLEFTLSGDVYDAYYLDSYEIVMKREGFVYHYQKQ